MNHVSFGFSSLCLSDFFSSLRYILALRRKLGSNRLKYQLAGILSSCAFLFVLPLTAGADLLFSIGYEDGTFGTAHTCSGDVCPSGFPSMANVAARTIVTSPTRAGSRAVKVYMPATNSGYLYRKFYGSPMAFRSEFERFNVARVGDERWYGFSVYIDPSTVDSQTDSPAGPGVFQAHTNKDACDISKAPHFAIYYRPNDGHWGAYNIYDSNACTTSTSYRKRSFDLGPAQKGVWYDFVIHAKWFYDSRGLLEVWRNGTKVVTQTGPNTYNDQYPEFVKWGVYNPWWGVKTPPSSDKVVFYFDEIKVGTANSRYIEVAP